MDSTTSAVTSAGAVFPGYWVVGLVDFGWPFRPFHANPPSLAFSRFFHVSVSVLRSKNATMLNYNPRTDGGLSHLRTAAGGGVDNHY